MVSDAFGERRATAIGLFGSIFPIGGIIGPNIGGFIDNLKVSVGAYITNTTTILN